MNSENKRLHQLLGLWESSPEDAFLLFALAKEYEKMADENKALEFYTQLKTGQPDYVGCYYHLAKLYERQENFDLALDTYQTGMQVAKKQGDQHAYSELSNAKLNLELEMD